MITIFITLQWWAFKLTLARGHYWNLKVNNNKVNDYRGKWLNHFKKMEND
jgi:hypothetical protein